MANKKISELPKYTGVINPEGDIPISISGTTYGIDPDKLVDLSGKVDKISGKGLSTNDYTTAEKDKLAGLATVATSGSYNDLSDKPTIPTTVGLATEPYVNAKIEDNIIDGVTTKAPSQNTVFDALSNKVDKESGKGLSSNDYTTADKNKLSGIEAGAEVNVNADWNATSGDAQIFNKPTIPIGIPTGGTAGQLLAKTSITNYDVTWVDESPDASYTSVVKHKVKAGEAMTIGQAVYVSGADGTNMIVSKASNTTESTSSKTMGLIAQTLTNNEQGSVVSEGLLSGLNTSSATVGDPVWLGADGNIIFGIVDKPHAPNHLVFIGIVTRVNTNNGEIFVKVQNGFELDELHDVDLKTTVPVNGHVLGYNGTLWVNKTIAELGGVPSTRTITINGVSQDLTENREWNFSPNLDPLEFDVNNRTVWNNGPGNIESNTFFGQNTTGSGASNQDIHITSYGSNVLPFGNGPRNTAVGSEINTHPWATATTDGVFMGYNIRPSTSSVNEILIGNNISGTDSNSVVLGNTLITKTRLRGQVYMGSIKLDAMNTAPASATDTGTVGEIRYTATHIYVCTATNTWVRTALDTWI